MILVNKASSLRVIFSCYDTAVRDNATRYRNLLPHRGRIRIIYWRSSSMFTGVAPHEAVVRGLFHVDVGGRWSHVALLCVVSFYVYAWGLVYAKICYPYKCKPMLSTSPVHDKEKAHGQPTSSRTKTDRRWRPRIYHINPWPRLPEVAPAWGEIAAPAGLYNTKSTTNVFFTMRMNVIVLVPSDNSNDEISSILSI